LTCRKLSDELQSTRFYRFNLEEISTLIGTLEAHNLTCALLLRQRDELWKEVNEQLTRNFDRTGIITAQSPSAHRSISEISYFDSPMVLIAPRGNQQGDRRVFKDPGLVGATFTFEMLSSLSRWVTNPRDNDRRPLLFFG
jgi:hypothetical protein